MVPAVVPNRLTRMIEVVPFDQLPNADLTVEAIYEGGNTGDMRDDPLGRLIPVGNQGGVASATAK